MNRTQISELKELIDINKDAYTFYDDAIEQVDNPRLVSTFKNLSALHKSVCNSIIQRLEANGEKAYADKTYSGTAAKWWGELMGKISNDTDETLVSHLEEAEDRCLHSMQDATQNDDLDASTRTFLANELQTLRKTHDYMKELKDNMAA